MESAAPEITEVPTKWKSIVRVKPLSDNEIISTIKNEKDPEEYTGAEGDTITMKLTEIFFEKYTFDKVIHPEED